MPGLVRKLLIIAAVDGLILQPYGRGSRNNNGGVSGSTFIEYKTRRIQSLPRASENQHRDDEPCLESHGLVGLLSVASYSFLISITQREQVAQVLGKPIFVITGVTIIPLSSQEDASKAISQAQRSFDAKESKPEDPVLDSSDSEIDPADDFQEQNLDPTPAERGPEYPAVDEPGSNNDSSVAENFIQKRGRYGRFAAEWLARKGWTRPSRFSPSRASVNSFERGDSVELDDFSALAQRTAVSSAEASISSEEDARTYDDLMPKLLKYTKMMLGSRSFYFSYDYDITRRFGAVETQPSQVPLFSQVDPVFFWNRHLMRPLIESGKPAFVLPIMQGFIGQHEFIADKMNGQSPTPGETQEDETPELLSPTEELHDPRKFLLTLISRRSVKRSGLRYLRRGVDDDGNVANTVETEQILSSPSWDPAERVHSLLQLRGSIPLYFSQSPYYFKPVPILRHSTQTNQLSFDKHFTNIGRRYGKVQAVCLLDKHGVETKIGEAYEKYLDDFNKSDDNNTVGYKWFDFHSECRGMKFENVKRLVDELADTLDDFGDTVIQDNEVVRNQTGIVRTNCMDCLDRTGVSQCAFGQRALENQLEREGYTIDLRTSLSTQWFNILWADNGDAISKQYSSTAALKGDYTRTRKRDYRGAFNDLGLTLSRYYNNIVTDYFSQACIDYLLGDVTTRVFDEFEMDLESADPGISIEKIRQNAIESSREIVIGDDTEEFIGGWTILSPHQPNTLRTLPFEQSVLLLTDAAVYCCRFDWNTEKVTSFERIDLRSITSIKYGTYITSILTEAQMDEKRNIGIAIAYQPSRTNIFRINTRSLQSLLNLESGDKQPSPDWDLASLFGSSSTRFMAMKLPTITSSVAHMSHGVEISEIEGARSVCHDIERMIMNMEQGQHSNSNEIERQSIIEETDIISLEEARKQTGIIEHLVFDIKKLVWA